MTPPTRIVKVVRVQYQYSNDCVRELEAYECDNGKTYNKDELAEAIDISANTLKARFYRSEGDIFSTNFLRIAIRGKLIPKSETVPAPKVVAWSRANCKRKGILCKYYSECQNKRLGLKGAGKWESPSNTDTCYEAVKIKNNLKAVNYL